jgi:hypothetical protein
MVKASLTTTNYGNVTVPVLIHKTMNRAHNLLSNSSIASGQIISNNIGQTRGLPGFNSNTGERMMLTATIAARKEKTEPI